MSKFNKSYKDLYNLPKMGELMRYELKQEMKVYKLLSDLHKEENAFNLSDNLV